MINFFQSGGQFIASQLVNQFSELNQFVSQPGKTEKEDDGDDEAEDERKDK